MDQWQSGWVQAVVDAREFGITFSDSTFRMLIVTGVGGDRVRLELSNRFGDTPVRIGGIAIAVGDEDAVPAFFAGSVGATIGAGETRRTDPMSVHVDRGDEMRVDLYLPETTVHSTANFARTPVEVSVRGDHVGRRDFPAIATPTVPAPDDGEMPIPLPFLRGVEVSGGTTARVVVCLGDSITAGGWPDKAAALLGGTVDVAMLNRGIAGNRLRTDPAPSIASYGPSGLSRFDDDVLATAGVTDVVIALGTNDLGLPGAVAPLSDLPSPGQLIDGYGLLAQRATAAGLAMMTATITPFLPADGYDGSRDQIRTVVNDWIRSAAPTVVDFDLAVRSATAPERLADEFDSGDHLHPNENGEDQLARTAANVIAGRLGRVTV